jgi:hypothetical protein
MSFVGLVFWVEFRLWLFFSYGLYPVSRLHAYFLVFKVFYSIFILRLSDNGFTFVHFVLILAIEEVVADGLTEWGGEYGCESDEREFK